MIPQRGVILEMEKTQKGKNNCDVLSLCCADALNEAQLHIIEKFPT